LYKKSLVTELERKSTARERISCLLFYIHCVFPNNVQSWPILHIIELAVLAVTALPV